MQQAERYQKWLCAPESSTNQVIASKARHSDTSMWLVRSNLYEAWRREGTLLWITGKPGAGKTVHCSVTINDLESLRSGGGSQIALAYFYCDFRNTQKQSYRNLLASLLVDLSTQSDTSDNILRELYSKYGNGSRFPRDDDLAQCLKEVLRQSGGTQYIVVDALDEMPNYGLSSSRRETLELVKDLIGLRLPELRICVTSRPEEDISRVLRTLTSQRVVLEEQQEHRKDITQMIRATIESHEKMQAWGQTIKEEAIEMLSSKADGM
ncbi:hypothetical protein BC834DRAFT_181064 [Gloeopeniophorella convolvens]|nr:hypothetical protein BC834DRAFT_181064 [Gloeopeniophorella convolvens]